MKIASWNVNSLNVRLPQVLAWLAAEQPDVLALQETKLVDEKFPRAEIEAAGYYAMYSGQKTYNGVALLSRQPAQDIVTAIPNLDDVQRRVLAATFNDVRVIDLYVPNGESVESDKYRYKLGWLEKVGAWIQREREAHSRLVVLGDFNIAPEPRDVHDPKQWEGHVLFSEPERAAFRQLLAAGLCDTFRLFDQPDKSFSWWDYRMQGFRRNHGLRIDHILASDALCKACTGCRIDRGPRAHERPSDHAPVVAEFNV
jgi:exodeoxyribonuclease III